MSARTFRLGLERLDDRNAPSSLSGNAVATAEWMAAPVVASLPNYTPGEYDPTSNNNSNTNQKPQITNFEVTVSFNLMGRFSGKVLDENPGGLTVTISGPQGCLNGSGQTVTTDADGNFEFVGQLVHGTDCGMVFADTADAQGLTADQAEYSLTV